MTIRWFRAPVGDYECLAPMDDPDLVRRCLEFLIRAALRDGTWPRVRWTHWALARDTHDDTAIRLLEQAGIVVRDGEDVRIDRVPDPRIDPSAPRRQRQYRVRRRRAGRPVKVTRKEGVTVTPNDPVTVTETIPVTVTPPRHRNGRRRRGDAVTVTPPEARKSQRSMAGTVQETVTVTAAEPVRVHTPSPLGGEGVNPSTGSVPARGEGGQDSVPEPDLLRAVVELRSTPSPDLVRLRDDAAVASARRAAARSILEARDRTGSAL